MDVSEIRTPSGTGFTLGRAAGSSGTSTHNWLFGVALIEFSVVASTAYLASIVYHRIVFGVVPSPQQYIVLSLLLAACFSLICLVDDQYEVGSEKWARNGISRGAGAVALAFAFFLSFSFLLKLSDDYSRGTFLLQLAAVFPALLTARTLLIQRFERAILAGRLEGRKLVVVSLVGVGQQSGVLRKLSEAADRIVRWHNVEVDPGKRPEGAIGLQGMLAGIRDECRRNRPDVIVIAFDASSLGVLDRVVETFYELPANLQLLPTGLAPMIQRARMSESGRLRVIEISWRPSLVDRALKRAMDLVIATGAVIAFAPLLLLVAIAIKLDSRGPVLFRQSRHGFNNEPIEVLKFRTMFVGGCGEFQQTVRNDPRITRVGQFLRRSNIDELPQLFNVIRGDMSLVGPRPHAVEHNEAFAQNIRWLNRRHSVKPGITGWAQVNGFRGATDTHDKMQRRIDYDLYYVDNWSFFFDVKILLMTIFSKSAYDNAF